MRYLFNTKIALWFFNRYFGIPLDATIVQLRRNSIHFTYDWMTFKCRTFQLNLVDFPVIKRLQTILLLPFALLSKGFAFLLLTDTASTNNRDCAISQYASTTNHSVGANGYVASQVGGDDWRFLLNFTLSSGSGTISAVTLNLYQHVSAGTNTGLNLEAHELTRTDWTETGVTWNKYDGVNNWTSAGGDFSATIISAIAHTNGVINAYRTWSIGPDATNPIAGLTWGSDVHLIVRFSNTGNNPGQYENFRTKGEANPPYVEITYTAGGGGAVTPPPIFIIFN